MAASYQYPIPVHAAIEGNNYATYKNGPATKLTIEIHGGPGREETIYKIDGESIDYHSSLYDNKQYIKPKPESRWDLPPPIPEQFKSICNRLGITYAEVIHQLIINGREYYDPDALWVYIDDQGEIFKPTEEKLPKIIADDATYKFSHGPEVLFNTLGFCTIKVLPAAGGAGAAPTTLDKFEKGVQLLFLVGKPSLSEEDAETARKLIVGGADLTKTAPGNKTALMSSLEKGFPVSVSAALIEAGASLTVKSIEGKTPFDYFLCGPSDYLSKNTLQSMFMSRGYVEIKKPASCTMVGGSRRSKQYKKSRKTRKQRKQKSRRSTRK